MFKFVKIYVCIDVSNLHSYVWADPRIYKWVGKGRATIWHLQPKTPFVVQEMCMRKQCKLMYLKCF